MKKQKLIHYNSQDRFDKVVNDYLETGQWHVVPGTLSISVSVAYSPHGNSRIEERCACVIEEN